MRVMVRFWVRDRPKVRVSLGFRVLGFGLG